MECQLSSSVLALSCQLSASSSSYIWPSEHEGRRISVSHLAISLQCGSDTRTEVLVDTILLFILRRRFLLQTLRLLIFNTSILLIESRRIRGSLLRAICKKSGGLTCLEFRSAGLSSPAPLSSRSASLRDFTAVLLIGKKGGKTAINISKID